MKKRIIAGLVGALLYLILSAHRPLFYDELKDICEEYPDECAETLPR